MNTLIKMQDETASGSILFETILKFPSEVITVHELIINRVTQEVENYNQLKQDTYNGLVRPTDSEILLNGYKLPKGHTLNLIAQRKIAIQSFKDNGFFILVNNKQVTELDEEIFITPKTLISFVKLTPLVGG